MKCSLYKFTGEVFETSGPINFDSLNIRLYKVGNPQDKLIAYVYKLNKKKGLWGPISKNYASLPVNAGDLELDKNGRIVTFKFLKNSFTNPEIFQFAIYRTGDEDDDNYYRIYINDFLKNKYIQSASIKNKSGIEVLAAP